LRWNGTVKKNKADKKSEGSLKNSTQQAHGMKNGVRVYAFCGERKKVENTERKKGEISWGKLIIAKERLKKKSIAGKKGKKKNKSTFSEGG